MNVKSPRQSRPQTPFFPPFARLLFGRPPVCALTQLAATLRHLRQASLSQIEEVFAAWIPPELFPITPSGPNSRDRRFTQRVTFWAFLTQVLSPGCACREILRKIQAAVALRRNQTLSAATSAYCQARVRLPVETLQTVHQTVVDSLEKQADQQQPWCGRPVVVVDGSSSSLPDTAANQKVFPQPGAQKPGCGFPVARIVVLFCLATGALQRWVYGSLHIHESRLFARLFSAISRGTVVLGDCGFCSFYSMASLLSQGVDSVFRLHQARSKDFRQGKRLSAQERLVTWHKPRQRPAHVEQKQWDALPPTLSLRLVRYRVGVPGFRSQQIILVTTLLDAQRYCAEALAQLFRRRWEIELSFRDIKVTLGMDILRCKSPALVVKELWMHFIAYNLIRSLMVQAAQQQGVSLNSLSFKGTVDTLRHWAEVLDAVRGRPKRQEALRDLMLAIIAQDLLPHRPNRVEPRAKKRRPKNYLLLTKPRHQMRVPPHRNRPAKPAKPASLS
jgi:hypothetical protein